MLPRPLARINKIDPDELNMLKKRIDVAMLVIIFSAALILARLWYLQIYRGDEYAKLAENNRIRIQEIIAPRGDILDRTGQPIITNRPRFNVVWNREDTPDQNEDELLKDVAKIFKEDISVLLDRIRAATENPRYISIRLKEDVDWETVVAIENKHLSLPGVTIEAISSRDYLYGDLASHLIGYLGEVSQAELKDNRYEGYKNGDPIGKQGLEKLFEEHLRGEKGRRYLEVDVRGLQQRQVRIQEPFLGNNLHLTLDLELQKVAEEAMAGKAGAVVAMEVNTGNMLVMCSTPPLELQEFIGGISKKSWDRMLNDPLKPLINKTVQGSYPPGSIFKIVTALAAISEGLVTPDTSIFCSGGIMFGNRRFGCWKKGGHGTVNFQKALIESCDVYFYTMGMRLGVDKIARYAHSLGLGKKSGVELEHEKSGIIPTTEWKRKRYRDKWHEGETLSVAIGQGYVTTTPLQICRMTATVANGGTLYRPQIVRSITSPDGKTLKTFTPVTEGLALGSDKSLALIREALTGVVNSPGGTAKVVRLPDVLIAGKTGTAQVVQLSHVRGVGESAIPYKYRDHAWFTSFAPAEKPEIAITVLVEHGQHGGSAAGPVARAVFKRYFEMKNGIPASPEETPPQLPDVNGE